MRHSRLADLPLRLGELHHRFRVASERFRRYGLPLQSLIRIDDTGHQIQIDDLPEFIDLILEITDRGVALLECLFEQFDDLVATSQRLRTLVQQSLQVSYRIHSLCSHRTKFANSSSPSSNVPRDPACHTLRKCHVALLLSSNRPLQARERTRMHVNAKATRKSSNVSTHPIFLD